MLLRRDGSSMNGTTGNANAGTAAGLSGAKLVGLLVLVAATVLSVGARALYSGEDAGAATGTPAGGPTTTFVPGLPTGGGAPAEEEGASEAIEDALPYFTEASFFALIGFALGYASKKVLKLGLILLAVFFVGVQSLSYADVVSVDWGRAIELVNDFVLNLKENQSVTQVLKDRLPTVGGLGLGYWLGFRRG